MFLIVFDISKITIINKFVSTIMFGALWMISIWFVASSFIYKDRYEKYKYYLEAESNFNNAYVEKLYEEKEILRKDLETLRKENEVLAMILLSPSGKKMN